MERPSVRIVQPQQVETKSVDVSGSEADYLLSKYGYSTNTQIPTPIKNNLSFEEMVLQQERQEKSDRDRKEIEKQHQINAPRPVTFDSRNVGYSETKFIDIEDGFGIKVTIVSNMK